MRHLSARALARHRERSADDRRTARIRAHLSGCARCAELDSGLATISGMLANVPVPPMPELVAESIQAAISAEAVSRAAAPRSAVPAGEGAAEAPGPALPVAVTAGGPARSRRHRTRGWSSPLVLRGLAAASAVLLVSGIGFVLAKGASWQGATGSSTSSGGSGAVASPPTDHSYPAPKAAGEAGIPTSYKYAGKIANTTILTSGANFTPASLAAQVRRSVASATPTPSIVGHSSASPRSLNPNAITLDLSLLRGCLTSVSRGRTVLVATVARYQGRPATIIVLRPRSGSRFLDVVIVGPDCSASSPGVIVRTTVPAG